MLLSAAAAEEIALKALTYLASDDDLLEIFMTQTGLGPDELRARAADPHLLAGVLDFLLQSDSNVTQFADSAELKPEAVMAARRALPGGRDDAE